MVRDRNDEGRRTGVRQVTETQELEERLAKAQLAVSEALVKNVGAIMTLNAETSRIRLLPGQRTESVYFTGQQLQEMCEAMTEIAARFRAWQETYPK